MINSYTDALNDSRIIFLNGEINDDLTNYIVSKLLYLDSLNNEDITIYINSPGGIVSGGLAIIDTMELLNSKVNTIGYGMVASMGAIILASGNKRYCLKHTRCMIHQIYGGMYGKSDDVEVSYNNMLEIKKDVVELLSKKVGKSVKKVENDIRKDYWMNSKQALEYGIIDEIL